MGTENFKNKLNKLIDINENHPHYNAILKSEWVEDMLIENNSYKQILYIKHNIPRAWCICPTSDRESAALQLSDISSVMRMNSI